MQFIIIWFCYVLTFLILQRITSIPPVVGEWRCTAGTVSSQCLGHHQGTARAYFQSDCVKVSWHKHSSSVLTLMFLYRLALMNFSYWIADLLWHSFRSIKLHCQRWLWPVLTLVWEVWNSTSWPHSVNCVQLLEQKSSVLHSKEIFCVKMAVLLPWKTQILLRFCGQRICLRINVW